MVQWIPISNQNNLPKDCEQKLITYIPYDENKWKNDKEGKYFVSVAYFDGDHWIRNGYYVKNVVAWADVKPWIPELILK